MARRITTTGRTKKKAIHQSLLRKPPMVSSRKRGWGRTPAPVTSPETYGSPAFHKLLVEGFLLLLAESLENVSPGLCRFVQSALGIEFPSESPGEGHTQGLFVLHRSRKDHFGVPLLHVLLNTSKVNLCVLDIREHLVGLGVSKVRVPVGVKAGFWSRDVIKACDHREIVDDLVCLPGVF